MASKNLTADKILQPKDAKRLFKLLEAEAEKARLSDKDHYIVTDY